MEPNRLTLKFLYEFKTEITNRLRGDRCGAHQMERQWGNSSRDVVGGGSSGNAGDGGRLRLPQQHPRRQGLDAGADLSDSGGHVTVLPDNSTAAGHSWSHQLLTVSHHARIQLLHDLRRPANQNQSHRTHPGRKQETHPHRQIPLALRHGTGYQLFIIYFTGSWSNWIDWTASRWW